jgi:hypothetical protein
MKRLSVTEISDSHPRWMAVGAIIQIEPAPAGSDSRRKATAFLNQLGFPSIC